MSPNDKGSDRQLGKPQERFQNLLNEAIYHEATSKSIDIQFRPDYFDELKFKEARAVCQKFYTNLSVASSTGLILLLQLENIAIPLLKSGKSATVADLFDRYSITAKYIRAFYETDFHLSGTEGWKYLNIVRAMHQRMYKVMNEDNDFKLEHQKVWINQYDMAVTQFAFVALFMLNPNKCGAYNAEPEDLKKVTYYWRVISYYFGIEERYNIFVYDDDLDKELELLNLMLDHIKSLLDSKPRMEPGLKMAKGFLFAFEDFNTNLSFNILEHWWSPYISLSGRKELEPYTIGDRYNLMFFLFYFKFLFRSGFFLSIMNWVYKRRFDKWLADSDKIRKNLAKKYRNFKCELGLRN